MEHDSPSEPDNQEDRISCRFTTDGKYSTRSAYETQFAGSFADYEWQQLWTAKVDNKCKISLGFSYKRSYGQLLE
jgi:hypothetical protein